MKEVFTIKIMVIFCSCFTLYNCVKKDYSPPEDIEVQDFIWKGLNAYYINQDQVVDLSDTRFYSEEQLESYLQGFENPEDIFNSLVPASDVRSSLIEDYTLLETPSSSRSSFTNGMEFGVFKDPNRLDSVVGYVSHILPLSYSSSQDISRGEFFYAIINEEGDTIHLEENNYLDLVVNYEQDTLKLLMADFDGMMLTENNKRVDLVKEVYEYPGIYLNKKIDLGTQQVGYLMYNNDFSNHYLDDLNAIMLDFKNQSVNELVFDLRYAIGADSFARIVASIASMITGQFSNEVLIKETWNLKAQQWFELNQPDSLLTKFPTSLENNQMINGLNLTDVYIILNGNGFTGSSAIELLINSLTPYINVHVLGNTTNGDNLGSITLYDSPDYDLYQANLNHQYALDPVVLTFSNLNDETYETGITPTIQLCSNEDPLNLGELGENSDPILTQAINYIFTGSMGATSPCNPFGLEIIYHSIDSQRNIDKGVFIKQDLPNLGR